MTVSGHSPSSLFGLSGRDKPGKRSVPPPGYWRRGYLTGEECRGRESSETLIEKEEEVRSPGLHCCRGVTPIGDLKEVDEWETLVRVVTSENLVSRPKTKTGLEVEYSTHYSTAFG